MTVNSLLTLAINGVVPLDGAWGTELARHGLPPGTPPELWNLQHPEQVAEIPRAYAAAGARIVLTNTFGGNRCKLQKTGLAPQVAQINRAGAQISRTAVPREVLVCASIGPTGEFLEPLGELSPTTMEDIFAEQIIALLEGGADMLVIETMTDLGETLCALRAAKRLAPNHPVVASLTFDKGARGYATMMGVTPALAAQQLSDQGADIIGTNCGHGVEQIIEIVAELRAHTDKPIWARPNAGLPQLIHGTTVFPDSPATMAEKIPALVAAGASFIGGCCGTTPDHIRALVTALHTL
ncbi:MAG: homocysteine S-methyltransferase family protein [bacterium]|nr:homocysteine S-methyltransferase family protein [bacterium]